MEGPHDFDEIWRADGPTLWRAVYAFTGGRRDVTDDAVAEASTLDIRMGSRLVRVHPPKEAEEVGPALAKTNPGPVCRVRCLVGFLGPRDGSHFAQEPQRSIRPRPALVGRERGEVGWDLQEHGVAHDGGP